MLASLVCAPRALRPVAVPAALPAAAGRSVAPPLLTPVRMLASSKREGAVDEKDLAAVQQELTDTRQFVREFAPSIKIAGLAGKYARIIYIAANVDKCHDEVEQDMITVLEQMQLGGAFYHFMTNPMAISNTTRRELMRATLLKVGVKNENVLKLGSTLARDGQTALFYQVAKAYSQLLRSKEKKVDVVLTVASAADAGTLLNEVTPCGRKLAFVEMLREFFIGDFSAKPDVTVRIDASLLGGCTIQVGDLFVDNSLARALNRAHDSAVKNVGARLDEAFAAINREPLWTNERALGKSQAAAWDEAAKLMGDIPKEFASAAVDAEAPLLDASAQEQAVARLFSGDLYKTWVKGQHNLRSLGQQL